MGKPKIRFKGYEDDWEQRKVGNFLTESREVGHKGDVAHKMTVKLWSKGICEKNEAGSSNTQYFIRHTGQFIYSKLDFLNCAFGVVPKNLESFETTADVPAFDCNEINPYFMFYTAIQPAFYKKNGIIADGSRKAKRIHVETFLNMPFFIPNLEEQNKIVDALSSLDHLITLHQRKCEETKSLKKYMLQKMFPENGNCVPKIRFSGFADAWEQRKLGEVAQEFKSGNSLKADEIDITGDYPVYGGNGLRGYTSTYNHDGEYALIGRQGALCGNMNYSVGKAYFTEHAVVVKADENNDTRFLYYMLDTMNLGQYSDQSAQPGLAVNKLVKLENQFPMKEEQQRIGWYFSNIDHLITLHQHKCDELQKLKKFMLQNMFV